ncbi:MAG: hypothetical protein WC506_03500 [Candidatus Micrarchaeia archaeon]
MNTRKGQGSTEYLVILAVVLIVALVAIALLGFFPGLSTDAQKAQSDSYWQGTAYPFRIVEHKASNGALTVVLQNADSKKLTLTSMTVGNGSTNSSIEFLGGEKKAAFVINNTGVCGNGSTRYDIAGNAISFTYDSASIAGQKQGGDAAVKDLIGTCG